MRQVLPLRRPNKRASLDRKDLAQPRMLRLVGQAETVGVGREAVPQEI